MANEENFRNEGLFGLIKFKKNQGQGSGSKKNGFNPGDLVVHKLTRYKFLIDRLENDGQIALVETEQGKKVNIGVHKLEKLDQNKESD